MVGYTESEVGTWVHVFLHTLSPLHLQAIIVWLLRSSLTGLMGKGTHVPSPAVGQ